jgi:hypothetical protein
MPEMRVIQGHSEGQDTRPGTTLFDGDLKVVIYGNPEALIFKNRLYGKLTADICGDCGHVELRVENPEELYDHYHEASE